MKKLINITPILLLILVYSCNNENLGGDEPNPDNTIQRIPSKISYTISFVNNTLYMNFNENGLPSTYTNTDSTTIFKKFVYDSNTKLTQFINFDGSHGRTFNYFYENEQLDSISCSCHNGVTHVQVSSLVEYNGNIINIVSNPSEESESITRYTFQSNNYETLTEIAFIYPNSEGYTPSKQKIIYDSNQNPISLEYYTYNNDTEEYDLIFVENQTFDENINIFKDAQHLDMVFELQIFPFGENISYLDILNRFAKNNPITKDRIAYLPSFPEYEITYDYVYDEDGYPTSYDYMNYGSQLREFTVEYHDD